MEHVLTSEQNNHPRCLNGKLQDYNLAATDNKMELPTLKLLPGSLLMRASPPLFLGPGYLDCRWWSGLDRY